MVLPKGGIALPPDLEQFAAEAIAAGHYRDTADVVRAGVELRRRRELARADVLASVLAAREEGDRSGCLTADEVAARVRETIARWTGAAA